MIKKKILITSGSTFLAKELAEKLLCQGHEVILVDCFSSGKSQLACLENYPHFTALQHDICCGLYFDVDEVYHLSTYLTDVSSSGVDAIKTVVFGTYNLLCLAKRAKAKFLHLVDKRKKSPCNGIEQAKELARTLSQEFQKENVFVKIAEVFFSNPKTLQAHVDALQRVMLSGKTKPSYPAESLRTVSSDIIAKLIAIMENPSLPGEHSLSLEAHFL